MERERAEEEQRLLQQRINEAAEEERRRAEMCATLLFHTACPRIAPSWLVCKRRPWLSSPRVRNTAPTADRQHSVCFHNNML